MTERRLASAAGVVGLAVLGSRFLGLAREAAFTALFGAGRELDAFLAAFRIPNLFRDLLAEGALSAAFVTVYARTADREGAQSALRLAQRVLTNLLLVTLAIVALGVLFAPTVVGVIAPGFSAEPGKAELTVGLTRVLFPFLVFTSLAAIVMGILNAHGRFGLPASASMFFNLGAIFFGLLGAWWLAPDYVGAVAASLRDGRPAAPAPGGAERAIWGMAIGTLLGGVLQLAIQLPTLFSRVGFRPRFLPGFADPTVREVLWLMGPAAIGVAAVQVNVAVNTIFASGLGDGAVSWLGVAFRLYYLPIGVIGVALGTVVLPAAARSAGRGDVGQMGAQIAQALELMVVLCVPAAVGLVLVAEPTIGAIYERGRFTPEDTRIAATVLSAYSVGLAGYAGIKILAPGFYALGDTKTPMLVSLASIATNFAANATVVWVLLWGPAGLALATSLVSLSNAGVLLYLLRRRIGPFAPGLGRRAIQAAAAAAGMALATRPVVDALFVDGGGFARHLLASAAGVGAGLAAYAATGAVVGIPMLRDPRRLLRRRPSS